MKPSPTERKLDHKRLEPGGVYPTRRKFIQLSGAAGLGFVLSQAARGANPVAAKKSTDPRAKLPTVNEEISVAAKSAPQSMRFEGRTPADLAAWQKRFSQKMIELIGPTDPPARWTTKTIETKTFPDFIREELLLSADGVPSLPLYLLRPADAGSKKLPIVLCLHGHGTDGHDSVAGRDDIPQVVEQIKKYNYDYARKLARQGFMTVAPCFTPFGRRLDQSQRDSRTDPCAMTFVRYMVLGRTLLGENIRDARWALSYAASRPEGNGDRMGCTGLSYGGRMTMMTTAFDPRVKVAVISGAQNFYEERLERDAFCGGQVIPGLLKYGDIPEVGSLIAPRPAVWETGDADPGMPPQGKAEIRRRVQKAYDAAGQPDAVSFYSFKGGHVWNGTTGVPLLNKVLKSG